VRLQRIAEAWLHKRLESTDRHGNAVKAIAWGVGRRVAAQLLDEGDAKEALWPLVEQADGLTNADVDQAIAKALPAGSTLRRSCWTWTAPLSDDRLRHRRAVPRSLRARLQVHDRQRLAGLGRPPVEGAGPGRKDAAGRSHRRSVRHRARHPARSQAGARNRHQVAAGHDGRFARRRIQVIADGEPPNPHALDYWLPKGKSFIRFSEALAIFGRAQSESAGKPGAIAALAQALADGPIEEFDCEQMAINVLNGTLRFTVERMPDGSRKVAVSLHPHDREDLITAWRRSIMTWRPGAAL
jgi:putative DNA primase/helicase